MGLQLIQADKLKLSEFVRSEDKSIRGFSSVGPDLHVSHSGKVVLVLPIRGVLSHHDYGTNVYNIIQSLEYAYGSSNIDGIILRVCSPGGFALAGNALYAAVNDKNKPVYALVNLAASAAYKAILTCDKIYAESPESEFGSIGSLFSINVLSDMFNNIGVKDFYADKSVMKNDVWRAFDNYDPSLVKKYINETNELFLDSVIKHRNLSKDSEALDGRLVFYEEAKKLGLADGISSLSQIISSHF